MQLQIRCWVKYLIMDVDVVIGRKQMAENWQLESVSKIHILKLKINIYYINKF